MCNRVFELLEQTIDEGYKLEREENHRLLKEEKKPSRLFKIRSVNRHTFAFSLDCEKSKPFTFFSPNPPSGIARMCDAIMACHHNNRCYLFLVEMKTQHKDDYKKQITNGKLFCDWLLQLYKAHGHISARPIFVSILIWFPRQQPEKGGTAHHDKIKEDIAIDQSIFDHAFKIENQSTVSMFDIFKKIA